MCLLYFWTAVVPVVLKMPFSVHPYNVKINDHCFTKLNVFYIGVFENIFLKCC